MEKLKMLLARCCYIMSLLLVPALSESSGGAKSLQLEEQTHCEEACHPLTEYCDRAGTRRSDMM